MVDSCDGNSRVVGESSCSTCIGSATAHHIEGGCLGLSGTSSRTAITTYVVSVIALFRERHINDTITTTVAKSVGEISEVSASYAGEALVVKSTPARPALSIASSASCCIESSICTGGNAVASSCCTAAIGSGAPGASVTVSSAAGALHKVGQLVGGSGLGRELDAIEPPIKTIAEGQNLTSSFIVNASNVLAAPAGLVHG